MALKLSSKGIELIKSFEGCKLQAYKVLSSEKYYTIGWGHYGSDVYKGMTITQKQADELFLKDVQKYVDGVNNAKFNFKPNQNQFDALVSFAYNLGVGVLKDFEGLEATQVCNEMLLYVNCNGTPLEGLRKRRRKEVELFKTPMKVYDREITRYKETGTFYPNCTIYFRNNPSVDTTNPIQGTYNKGEYVHYDLVVITDRYVWISWISAKLGIRRYLPIREYNRGKFGTLWGDIK